MEAWIEHKNAGQIAIDDQGLIDITIPSAIDFVIDMFNFAIVNDIIEIDRKDMTVNTLVSYDNLPIANPINKMELSKKIADKKNDSMMPLAEPNDGHGCIVEGLSLLMMCQSNYEELRTFYNTLIAMSVVDPTIQAWSSAAAYWVAKVAPNGDWDYKVQPGFSPWHRRFCCYFNGAYNHVNSEYIGNFNYGYTGSLLFSLNVLHYGSSAVSGFDPADTADWPAIDAGYANAP